MAGKKFYLQVEPADKIRFVGDLNCEIKTSMKITNKSDHRQAYKVKCTRNDLFKIRPSTGVLEYGQSAVISITFKAKDSEMPADDRHHFGIYHIPAPEGCTCEGAWSEHYGPPQGECRIRVAFEQRAEGKGSL